MLLRAAEEVFADRGPASSLELIAEHAGVSRPLLYRYFGSLEALYLACHRAAREEFVVALADAVNAEVRLEDKLRAGLAAYLAFVRERPSRWQVLYGPSAVASTAAEASALRFATAEITVGLIREAVPGIAAGQAAAWGHVVSGAAEQFAKWWLRTDDVDVDEATELLMGTLWIGLERQVPPGPVG